MGRVVRNIWGKEGKREGKGWLEALIDGVGRKELRLKILSS